MRKALKNFFVGEKLEIVPGQLICEELEPKKWRGSLLTEVHPIHILTISLTYRIFHEH